MSPLLRALYLGAYLALTVLQWLWHGLLFPAPAAIVVLAVLPLLAPLPWLLRRSAPRAMMIGAYLSLFYFVHGVTEAMVSAPQRALALTETGLSLALCALVVAAHKLRSRQLP